MLCLLYIFMFTILSISSIMIRILSCFIVISHIIYFITYLTPYQVDITKRVLSFSPRLGDRNHIQPQTMGDPIFTT